MPFMRFAPVLIWILLLTSGCIVPDMKDSQGTNSPMMAAYQAALPQDKPSPFPFPSSPQTQAYALTGGILVLMVFVILKSSQTKEK
jgi:hypothetical protein